MKALDLINRVETKRKSIQGTEFLAPSTHNQHIISVDGLAYKLNPDVFMGQDSLCVWRVFENNSIYVRQAHFEEVRTFVNTLPTRKGIIMGDLMHVWSWHDCSSALYPWVPAVKGNYQSFDFVTCGYSGTRFYVRSKPERSKLSAQLRQALVQEVPPERLHLSGLTPEMLAVYNLVYVQSVQSEEDKFKNKINEIMRFTGAELVHLKIDGEAAVVRYRIPSVNYEVTSRIATDSFKVISAGVCLNHRDQDYHLKTLIPIIEHGKRNRLGDWR